MDEEARKEVLEDALKEIKKRYGDGAVMRLGEAHHLEVEAIPTG
ncbi:MAG: DNA recombination/repair protein RecA, partial [Anaerolineales bacterium]